jgi:hypothetical protein
VIAAGAAPVDALATLGLAAYDGPLTHLLEAP